MSTSVGSAATPAGEAPRQRRFALGKYSTVLILVAVAMLAMTRIWTRVLARTDKPTTITFWLMFGQLPAGLLMLPFFPLPEEWPSLFALALVAMCGLAHGLAHYLLARGYAIAPVATLAPAPAVIDLADELVRRIARLAEFTNWS